MKALILNIAIFVTLAISMPIASAEANSFPEEGKSYNVTFAQNTNLDNGQIKVMKKGESPWIYVEYTYTPIQPRHRTTQAEVEKAKSITRKFWINTQWIVTAAESDTPRE